jgi:hypothetical protein
MPTRKPWNCRDKHSDLADVLAPMLESQAKRTGGRHRCAGCAYEAGIQEGLRRAQIAINSLLKTAKPIRTYTFARD